jgi:LysR substrate binding domain.
MRKSILVLLSDRWRKPIFDAEDILQEPFLLLCHQDDVLAQVEQAEWAMLAGRNLVVTGLCFRQPLTGGCGFAAVINKGAGVQEIGHPATLFPMVEAGIGISILPALALPLPSGRKLAVRRLYPEINRHLMLIKRKNRSLTPAAEAIWQEVRQQASLLAQQRALKPAF